MENQTIITQETIDIMVKIINAGAPALAPSILKEFGALIEDYNRLRNAESEKRDGVEEISKNHNVEVVE